MLAVYVNSMCDKLNVWLEHRRFYFPLEHPFPAHEKPDLLVYLYSTGFTCFMDLFNDTESYVKNRSPWSVSYVPYVNSLHRDTTVGSI